MNKSQDILRDTLKFRKKYLNKLEEDIQLKRACVDQLETDKALVLIEIADMERAISFLERVQ